MATKLPFIQVRFKVRAVRTSWYVCSPESEILNRKSISVNCLMLSITRPSPDGLRTSVRKSYNVRVPCWEPRLQVVVRELSTKGTERTRASLSSIFKNRIIKIVLKYWNAPAFHRSWYLVPNGERERPLSANLTLFSAGDLFAALWPRSGIADRWLAGANLALLLRPASSRLIAPNH